MAAAHEGLLKPVQSKVLDANVPAHLRDPKGQWFGLSVRARTIFFNTHKVKPAQLSSYEDLAEAKVEKQTVSAHLEKVYNQSLVGMMMADIGPVKTRARGARLGG